MEAFSESIPSGSEGYDYLQDSYEGGWSSSEKENLENNSGKLSFEDAKKKYDDKCDLVKSAKERIDVFTQGDFGRDGEKDKENSTNIKYLKVLMPGLIHAAVFGDLDNKIVGQHVMSNVLAESPIGDGGTYIYDDFDKKAVNLLGEVARADSLDELITLNNALRDKGGYTMNSVNEEWDDGKKKDIEQMEGEINRLKRKRREIGKRMPWQEFN